MAERLLEGEADVTGTAGEASSEDLQTVAGGVDPPRSVGVEQVGRWALERWGWWSCWPSWVTLWAAWPVPARNGPPGAGFGRVAGL